MSLELKRRNGSITDRFTETSGPTIDGCPAFCSRILGVQGMEFDRSTVPLYAWIHDDSQGNSAFSQIDLNSGQAQAW